MTQLDIFSDPICPWCYIGKAYLERALAARPDHGFTIRWHPFQLNPEMPAAGLERRAYLEAKFGGREAALKVYGEIARRAEAAGLVIDFGAITRTPNTLDAHRLIHWAGLEGRQPAVVAALFDAYFTAGRDIGDADVLADIGEGVGLARALVVRLLHGNADIARIRAADAEARDMGMSGVPTFVIGGKHVLTGAQPPEIWGQVIDDLAAPPVGAP